MTATHLVSLEDLLTLVNQIPSGTFAATDFPQYDPGRVEQLASSFPAMFSWDDGQYTLRDTYVARCNATQKTNK